MEWTAEQRRVIEHPMGAHAVVRAAPGAGKTTTLVGRVVWLVENGAAPERIRVVMFNKSIQETFVARLAEAGVRGVFVQTFDALGLAVLRAAEPVLGRRYTFHDAHTRELARHIWRDFRDDFDSPDDIEAGVVFWKAHLVPPARARCPKLPALVAAYAAWEKVRLEGEQFRVGFEDLVYTAVGVLGRHPRLLGPIDHVLIDELQDVNKGRVELLRRLIGPQTAVMGVGDEDQGINEWCGAHPRYFRDFAATFPSLPTHEYSLSTSFRFGATLAAAANNVIHHNKERAPLRAVGGGKSPGLVRSTKDIAAAVRGLLEDGWSPGEIAVLYRSRTQGAAALAALAAARVPLHTDDAALLRTGAGPELLLGYLEAATQVGPVEFEAAWKVVQAPTRYIQKEPFRAQVVRHGAGGLRAVLKAHRFAASAGQNPGALRAMDELDATLGRMARATTAGGALERLDQDVDIEAQLRNRLRSERDQELAIASFYAVKALLSGLGVPAAGARAALDSLDVSLGAPRESRVYCSTIHKAKGREWRCVVLPGLMEGACPAEQRGEIPGTDEEPNGVAQSPWMEQERRIFYVGLTRAIDQVVLQVPEESPSRFVDELRGKAAKQRTAAGPRSIVAELMRRDTAVVAMGRPWPPEDDEALTDAWEAGEALPPLAERFGRSTSAVAARLVRLGLVASRGEARGRGL